ncbi:hypothetical protein [Antarctobacter heliothermus]|uniref:RiboL-PSP-HEPN domain-containing protein n=1 Tax=Antarctobacter heliothermus TaxID=74033 RepID=A0A239FYN5_9RHOB|nr:hypothetical protein [Antarctobacter heliothermus]SNS62286.1 hypothetical protein SAMN04488078_102332 [Antarctobacter heliothermus]
MTIEEEIDHFDTNCHLLLTFVNELATVAGTEKTEQHTFLAEAVTFRLYRVYERLVRSAFLHYCVTNETLQGAQVVSKLTCPDWETAEDILKSGNKFLDWGNVVSVKKISNLVFREGFPIGEMLAPFHSDLINLQRLRNFVAHDSKEAEEGFKRARTQYVRIGDAEPRTVGELALYRRDSRSDVTLKKIHTKVSGLSSMLTSL